MVGQITQRLKGELPLPKQDRDYNQSHYITLNNVVFLFLNLTFYMGFSLFIGCVPLGKSRGRGWDVTGQALLTCIFHINTTGQHIKRTSYTMA